MMPESRTSYEWSNDELLRTLSSFSWVYHLRSLISVSFFLPVDDELVVFLGVGVGALLLFVYIVYICRSGTS